MTSNPAAGTQNGVANANLSHNQKRPPIRRKQLANPLVSSRRIQKPKPNNTPYRPAASNAPGNPTAGPSSHSSRPAARPDFTIKRPSPEPGPPDHSYPVYLASPDELESLRYHLVRLQGKESLDVTDQSTFVRPIKLLRRDVYAKPNAQGEGDGDQQVDPNAEAEKERQETLKAERQRQKDEVAKQIAPSETKKKPVAGKRKTESRLGIETAADEKKRLLRYEETLPWILEDFDAQRTWVGSYEASLSDCHVLLIRDESGGFKLIPVEKTYRFKEKDRIRAKIDPEKEEEKAKEQNKDPKWLRDREKKKELQQARIFAEKASRGMKTGASRHDEPDESGFGGGSREDMDFDQDELFADDEENPLFEGDVDDQKEAKDRIVSDQRKANYFDLNDETAVLEQDEQQKKEALEHKKEEKGARKALIKREGNYAYEDSDDENPYESESPDEDDEAKQQADQEKNDVKAGDAANLNGSGASTKGANTPSDRKKNLKGGMKRPGSPNLSEASGNESTRKKAKLHKGIQRAADADVSGASGNESAYKKKTAASKLGGRAPLSLGASMRSGSGSDTDTIKRSRGKMSGTNTPAGTRAQSPAAAGKGKSSISRAASPAGRDVTPAARANSAAPVASGNSTPRPVSIPTVEEVMAVIPPEGILMPALLAHYDTQEGWTRDHSRSLFSGLKSKVQFDTTTKRITRK